ncbi:uncharacterized protein LOC62_03G003548 [Vanrija pseudolonga]|uniref:Uncharacterized protein n=1 Tax=Vanrija pseudolonga TaxID=143232 RepID=A0AAF0Y4Q0_9TREE|nr:hypothetical protein LOC62_03G003548 [Vanrija pseudolonga]
MATNNYRMATYVSPYPELTEVVAWLDAYRAGEHDPEYMCRNCVSGGANTCPHWKNITGYTEAQYYAHMISIGRGAQQAEADVHAFRTIRNWQVGQQMTRWPA